MEAGKRLRPVSPEAAASSRQESSSSEEPLVTLAEPPPTLPGLPQELEVLERVAPSLAQPSRSVPILAWGRKIRRLARRYPQVFKWGGIGAGLLGGVILLLLVGGSLLKEVFHGGLGGLFDPDRPLKRAIAEKI